jgi:enoyl-CoA hydratase/carnithine racemase
VRLPRVVGRGRALELICTGREVDAAEMLQIGLVERVAPRERFDAELTTLAGTIARAGPLATRGAKRIVGLREEPGFRASREISDTLRRALEFSEDVDESIRAHREGRMPTFRGR